MASFGSRLSTSLNSNSVVARPALKATFMLSDSMKPIPLGSLLQEPVKVKRLTRSGQSVQATDNGKPLDYPSRRPREAGL